MGVTRVKEGVEFSCIAPGGFRILGAIDYTAKLENLDLVITSACDGLHSGPNDPHHRGEAFDVRSKGLENKDAILKHIMALLDGNHFFGFLEGAGTDNEHFHIQVKKGTVYP